ncbi:MAG: hypothetical protein JW816_02275 [Candidatus Buchananbacteria bacterium]|nr:hypothetical protein [Candidatus Buchananbacteria bacterium]
MIGSLVFWLVVGVIFLLLMIGIYRQIPDLRWANRTIREWEKLPPPPPQPTSWDFTDELPRVVVSRTRGGACDITTEGDVACPWPEQTTRALFYIMTDAVPSLSINRNHLFSAALAWQNHYPRGVQPNDRDWIKAADAKAREIIAAHRDDW